MSSHRYRLQDIDYNYLVEIYLTDPYNKDSFRQVASSDRAKFCGKVAKHWTDQQEQKPEELDKVESLKEAVEGALTPSNSSVQSAP